MRLNFSGVSEEEIREGVRRIGEVVREQVELYGTLTGMRAAAPRRSSPVPRPEPAAERAEDTATILRLPAKRSRAG
jgi:2-aminoadipate transaminase